MIDIVCCVLSSFMTGLAADNLVDGLTRVEEEHTNYHHYGQAKLR